MKKNSTETNLKPDASNFRIGWVTFEKHEGRKDIGSSRIRAKWLCNHWKQAEIYKQGREYDVLIFQKAYWVEMAREFQGIKIFDLCDPDFLHWGYKTKEMLDNVDAVTVSTQAMADQLKQFTDKPIMVVPDRIDLDLIKNIKEHKGIAKTAVWYGYSDNFLMLEPVLRFLEQNKLNLTVISNSNYLPTMRFLKPEIESGMSDDEIKATLYQQDKKDFWIEFKNFKWSPKTVNKDIVSGDIVINPRSKRGKWKYKSHNKTITAWALGMPVAENVEQLKLFLDEGERKKEAEKRSIEIKEKWDVKLSVEDYQTIISDIFFNWKLDEVTREGFKEITGEDVKE